MAPWLYVGVETNMVCEDRPLTSIVCQMWQDISEKANNFLLCWIPLQMPFNDT